MMPSKIRPVRKRADKTDEKMPALPTKNIVIIAISVGKRPLQGTKLFVIIASNRSRGESIIRQPMTPAAVSYTHLVQQRLN